MQLYQDKKENIQNRVEDLQIKVADRKAEIQENIQEKKQMLMDKRQSIIEDYNQFKEEFKSGFKPTDTDLSESKPNTKCSPAADDKHAGSKREKCPTSPAGVSNDELSHSNSKDGIKNDTTERRKQG